LVITQIVGVSATPRRQNQHWAGGTRSWTDSLLWHHGCHSVDLSLWILGSSHATDIDADFGGENREFGMTMDLSVGFVSDRGCLVTHALTYNTPVDVDEQWFITDHELFVRRDGGLFTQQGEQLIVARDWSDLTRQDSEMLAAIIDGVDCDYTIESVLPTMRALEQMQSRNPRLAMEHNIAAS
jgi:2-hydroxy-4-carboxymuconate semialdehyde hemiacetal dehydrogenase